MKKYLPIFKISLQQEFAYRSNFIMWRVRNIFQIFLVFFLWDSVFSDPNRIVFGYDRSKILTYVFGILIVRALVLSARVIEVPGEVSRGDLSNYLVRPLNYFKYWATRDLASKFLNISFAAVEAFVLYLILRPPFFLQTNPVYLISFLTTIVLAMALLFIMYFITGSVPFWVPEAAWGVNFLFMVVILEFLSGALFPLDVLPVTIQNILNLTPFPYLIYFPLQVYLGQVEYAVMFKGMGISIFWVIALWFFMKHVWNKGLKVYGAYGR
jgi:ABC-2 type transport system permease protein